MRARAGNRHAVSRDGRWPTVGIRTSEDECHLVTLFYEVTGIREVFHETHRMYDSRVSICPPDLVRSRSRPSVRSGMIDLLFPGEVLKIVRTDSVGTY